MDLNQSFMRKIWVKVTLFWYGCWLVPKTHPQTRWHPSTTYGGWDMDINQKLNPSHSCGKYGSRWQTNEPNAISFLIIKIVNICKGRQSKCIYMNTQQFWQSNNPFALISNLSKVIVVVIYGMNLIKICWEMWAWERLQCSDARPHACTHKQMDAQTPLFLCPLSALRRGDKKIGLIPYVLYLET